MLCGANQVFEIDYLQDGRWPKYINVESDMSYRMLFTVELIGPYRVCSCHYLKISIYKDIFFARIFSVLAFTTKNFCNKKPHNLIKESYFSLKQMPFVHVFTKKKLLAGL